MRGILPARPFSEIVKHLTQHRLAVAVFSDLQPAFPAYLRLQTVAQND